MATRSGVRKPKLDDSSSDKVVGEVIAHGSKDPRAQKLGSDWRAFIREEFDLSDAQRRDLDAIESAEREMVQEALRRAIDERGSFRFHPADGGEGELEVMGPKEDPQQEIHFVIFHCHFGGGKGWHCFWGPHRPDEAT
jgi:hypothetical protein